MRVIAGLPGDQARAIQHFLLVSNNPPPRAVAAAVRPTLPGAERIQRGGCRGCHGIGGSGGTIGPNLADLFERRSEDWIRKQIQNPRQHDPKTVMPELGLNDAEVTAMSWVCAGWRRSDAARAADGGSVSRPVPSSSRSSMRREARHEARVAAGASGPDIDEDADLHPGPAA